MYTPAPTHCSPTLEWINEIQRDRIIIVFTVFKYQTHSFLMISNYDNCITFDCLTQPYDVITSCVNINEHESYSPVIDQVGICISNVFKI